MWNDIMLIISCNEPIYFTCVIKCGCFIIIMIYCDYECCLWLLVGLDNTSGTKILTIYFGTTPSKKILMFVSGTMLSMKKLMSDSGIMFGTKIPMLARISCLVRVWHICLYMFICSMSEQNLFVIIWDIFYMFVMSIIVTESWFLDWLIFYDFWLLSTFQVSKVLAKVKSWMLPFKYFLNAKKV